MTARPVLILLVGLGLFPALRAEDKPTSPAEVEFFERKVRPLFVKHCYECHGPEAKKVGGGLRLDTRDGVRVGGGRGPAIVPGEPAKSLLLTAVRQTDELKMPPKSKLSAEEIADLEVWIKNGASDPRTGGALAQTEPKRGRDLWSLKPVRDPPVPAVKDASWPLNLIDRFLLSKLEEKGLKPAGPADKRTLIRRATFDLTGLPPTPEEIDAFLADHSPAAFAKVVDRLLASPAYGERWGRHWLDVVRYADTAGDNSDYPIPQAYKYRNWVINAINADMPYDEFVRRQLAGDLLPATDDADRHEKLIATGYLANARRFGSYDDLGNGLPYPWYLTYEDTIDNLGRTFLGLTINCCRCHDHKFDPFTQADYYALYGFFQSTRYPWPGIELDKVQRDVVPLVPADQVAAVENSRREKLASFDARVKELQSEKAAADKVAKTLGYFSAVVAAIITARADKLVEPIKAAKKSKEDFEKQPLPYPTAYAVADRPAAGKRKVGNACLQIKGDPERPGPEIPRRFPTILGGQSLPPDAKGSGRLELARWIVDPANPLTARVMVNRIWQYHFGRGIVPTPSDFGMQGQPPTHPELLDYLASRFVEEGWSFRAMHRRMLLSRAYQMSSADDAANAKLDVDNEFLWRHPRRRLDAESIRDALLAVSGALDRSPGGAHPFPPMPTWDFTQHKPFKAVYNTDGRSVYLMTQRIQRHPFLAIFDGADPNASTATRVTSTTPLQALYLMNDPFVHARASGLARRLHAERSDNVSRIELAYVLLFGRPPTAEELRTSRRYLGRVFDKLRSEGVLTTEQVTQQTWESFARGLVLSNEFVYLD
jgi:mono/diheme cytochrome c family protein